MQVVNVHDLARVDYKYLGHDRAAAHAGFLVNLVETNFFQYIGS